MAVGAFAAYNFVLRVPGHPILVAFVLGGVCAALASGIVFGLPSLRIKGFYLAVATLAAQFFASVGADQKFHWFSRPQRSAVISAQRWKFWAVTFDGPVSKYLLTLSVIAWCSLSRPRTWRGVRWVARGWPYATWTSRRR